MSINWQDLRPLNGSQYTAFEELCCQLASTEKAPREAHFTRVGAPDAGVECYWKLPDGSEWGWQAKFFLSTPGKSQWEQIDDSIKTALDKHPQLSRYVICLPLDREDPRNAGQHSFMDKWNDRVQKWKEWAIAKDMAVEYEYWGESQIFERLSREEHHGRYYFWFHKDLFSWEWFGSRVDEAIANVGPRYSPELDVQLPIAKLFNGLGKTNAFRRSLKDLLKQAEKALPTDNNELIADKSVELAQMLSCLRQSIAVIDQDPETRMDWDGISHTAGTAIRTAREAAHTLTSPSASKSEPTSTDDDKSRTLKQLASHYWHFSQTLEELAEFTESDEARLVNQPALLLVAQAGRGKTHLLCDVARHRNEQHLPTILLLGGMFNLDEPWSQIMKLLGLGCTRDEFIGALDTAAQVAGTRAVIMIDALNEGEGKAVWKKHLAGMLLDIAKHPWLGIVVSVRTSYEDVVVPEGLVPARLVRAEHYGFTDHEFEATKTFFNYYGIQRPSIPTLYPEFQNPLFLKIFCQGLRNKQLSSIPPGLQGITAIFRFFIDSVNEKLATPEYLDFNKKLPIVWKAIDDLAARMAQQDKDWLPLEEAQTSIDSFLPRNGYANSLYRHLLAEGVIAENRFHISDEQWVDGVHFAYERFADHLIVRHLLDMHLDTDHPARTFAIGNPLNKYVRDKTSCWAYQGLIEAFAIQVPERVGKELMAITPAIQAFDAFIPAFIDSLIWRDPKSIDMDVALHYINEHIVNDRHHSGTFLNALLTVAANPNHPFNADFLHRYLLGYQLADRDAWWSVYIHEQYRQHSAVDRLVEWGWAENDKSHISDESMRLCGMTLAWFLTTSNRFLRDRATKALVRIFTPRINLLRVIIERFIDVDDPYVLERLMAVAYGCAMRSDDRATISNLALNIYTWVFKDGHPPADILLRDYARGVIEVAVHRGMTLDVDLGKIKPPYHSTFPTDIPTLDELKAKYDNTGIAKSNVEYSQSDIWFSVMASGDFARYIIGTDFGTIRWLSRRIDEPIRPTAKEVFEAFEALLTPKQKRTLERYQTLCLNARLYRSLDEAKRKELLTAVLTDEDLDRLIQESEQKFRKQLGKRKASQLTREVLQYINDGDTKLNEEPRIDTQLVQRFILNRVFELGWTIERFGQFDHFINYNDMREAHKEERIGKKYQWIAYHEIFARLADNFAFGGDRWKFPHGEAYEGPWQDGRLRDIDPSWLVSRTKETGNWSNFDPIWWTPIQVQWDSSMTDRSWIRHTGDLPDVRSLIAATNPIDGSEWLTLNGFYRWENTNTAEDEEANYPKRHMNCFLRGYIVKQSDTDELSRWLTAKRVMSYRSTLSDPYSLDDVFFGEIHWAPAFLHLLSPDNYLDWISGSDGDVIPKPMLRTCDQYMQDDSGFDCSIDDSIHIDIPSRWIIATMGLNWHGHEGHFYNAQGKLVAFDPSINSPGPSALLVNRKLFLEHLAANEYTILWVATGEKVIITGNIPGPDWPGMLHLHGIFQLQKEHIDGNLEATLEEK